MRKRLAKGFTLGLVCIPIFLAGCGGANTAKPVYEGLLAEGAQPVKSSKTLPEIRQAPGVVLVLSQSTRDTVAMFKEPQTGERKLNYPIDKWIADIATPVRKLNPVVRTASDLRARSSGNWFVVLHWTALFQPFVIGGTIEYHVLDGELAQVAVFSAREFGNCDSLNPDAQAASDHYVGCYTRFLNGLIQKASNPLLSTAGI